MNQGKRYIRNTVFALYGTAALFVGLNRLYASTVDAQTTPWLRNTLALGLMVAPQSGPPPAMKPAELAALRDFTRLYVSGDFEVEIVGAQQYKVTFTPPPGSKTQLRARQKDDLLSLETDDADGTAGKAVLRIETPALKSLFVQDAPRLTLHGLQAEELSVSMHHVAAASLQQNQVARWKAYSSEPLEIQVDRATLAAGSLQTSGNLAIRFREETP